jgi:hypothetical protein
MQVEIERMPPATPGFTCYHVRADGITMARVGAETKSPGLLAQVLEAAVEGIMREGRPWMIR